MGQSLSGTLDYWRAAPSSHAYVLEMGAPQTPTQRKRAHLGESPSAAGGSAGYDVRSHDQQRFLAVAAANSKLGARPSAATVRSIEGLRADVVATRRIANLAADAGDGADASASSAGGVDQPGEMGAAGAPRASAWGKPRKKRLPARISGALRLTRQGRQRARAAAARHRHCSMSEG
jgi:hypothetical protein